MRLLAAKGPEPLRRAHVEFVLHDGRRGVNGLSEQIMRLDLKRVGRFHDGDGALARGEIDATIRRNGRGVVFALSAEAFLFEVLFAGLRVEATDAATVLCHINATAVEKRR